MGGCVISRYIVSGLNWVGNIPYTSSIRKNGERGRETQTQRYALFFPLIELVWEMRVKKITSFFSMYLIPFFHETLKILRNTIGNLWNTHLHNLFRLKLLYYSIFNTKVIVKIFSFYNMGINWSKEFIRNQLGTYMSIKQVKISDKWEKHNTCNS